VDYSLKGKDSDRLINYSH